MTLSNNGEAIVIVRRPPRERGVILIALLWILTALAVIALSFSRETFVEVAAARNTRDLSVAYYAARAGIATVCYQLLQRRLTPRLQQLELPGPPDPIDLGVVRGSFGDAEYEVNIQDESGKININYATEEQLKALVQAAGITPPDADVIVDSIMDWKDVDNLHRAAGAEDDYYQTLNPPYKAKNSNTINTIEELLLIRGISPDYFYGRAEKTADGTVLFKYGLNRYFTVYSPSVRININYAPLPVLMSIPGMTPQAAEQIYQRRKTKPFTNPEEISRGLGLSLSTTSMPLVSTEQTGIYTLTASANRMNSKVIRVIRAVIALEPRDPSGYRIYYWNENNPRL